MCKSTSATFFNVFSYSTKMSDAFSDETRLRKPVALVFESNSSYLGKEVLLNIRSIIYLLNRTAGFGFSYSGHCMVLKTF